MQIQAFLCTLAAALSLTASHSQAQSMLYPGGGAMVVHGIPGHTAVHNLDTRTNTDPINSPHAPAKQAQISTGWSMCNDDVGVLVLDDPYRPNGYKLQFRGRTYLMHAVHSRSGAPRLENGEGLVWLELANKSMLLDESQSIRLADDCQTPSQVQYTAWARNNNPDPLNLSR